MILDFVFLYYVYMLFFCVLIYLFIVGNLYIIIDYYFEGCVWILGVILKGLIKMYMLMLNVKIGILFFFILLFMIIWLLMFFEGIFMIIELVLKDVMILFRWWIWCILLVFFCIDLKKMNFVVVVYY